MSEHKTYFIFYMTASFLSFTCMEYKFRFKKKKKTSAVLLMVRYNKQDTQQKFYVTDLREDQIILGMPFLAAANPDIDWSTGTFDGEILATTQDAHL